MKVKVLVIDDKKNMRRIIVGFLEEKGDYEIFQASDGKEGIEIFEIHRPKIVIADLIMPGMRGEEVVRLIKRDFPETKVIALSGNTALEPVAKAAGCDVFLKKPFPLPELQETIEYLLRQNRD